MKGTFIKSLRGQVILASALYWISVIILNATGIGTKYTMLSMVSLSIVAFTAILFLHMIDEAKAIDNKGLAMINNPGKEGLITAHLLAAWLFATCLMIPALFIMINAIPIHIESTVKAKQYAMIINDLQEKDNIIKEMSAIIDRNNKVLSATPTYDNEVNENE